MPKNYSFPSQWYERSDFLSQRTKFGAEKVMGLTSKIQVTSNLHSRIWSLLLGSVEQGEKKDLQAFIHAKCARGTWKSPHTSCLGWGRNYGKSRMQNTCQRWRRNWHQSAVPSAFTELFSQVGFLLNIRNQDWFKGSWILRNPYQHSFEFWMPKCVECIHKDPLDSNNSCNCWYLMEEIRNSSFRAHSTSWIKFQKLQPWNLPKCNPPKSWRVLVSKDFPFQRGEKISGEPARYVCQTRGFWYQTSLGKPCRCHSIFNSGSTCRVLSSQSWLNFGQKKTSRWKILGFHRCLASFGNNGAPFLASRFLFDQNRRVICKNDRVHPGSLPWNLKMSPREDSFSKASSSSSMSIFRVWRISPTRYISPYFITNVKAPEAALFRRGQMQCPNRPKGPTQRYPKMLPKHCGSLEAYQVYPILLVLVVKVTDSTSKGWNQHWIFSQVSIPFKFF